MHNRDLHGVVVTGTQQGMYIPHGGKYKSYKGLVHKKLLTLMLHILKLMPGCPPVYLHTVCQPPMLKWVQRPQQIVQLL